jgi:hypothetical protein
MQAAEARQSDPRRNMKAELMKFALPAALAMLIVSARASDTVHLFHDDGNGVRRAFDLKTLKFKDGLVMISMYTYRGSDKRVSLFGVPESACDSGHGRLFAQHSAEGELRDYLWHEKGNTNADATAVRICAYRQQVLRRGLTREDWNREARASD